MKRMSGYGHYITGDNDFETSKYTWEDLYAAMTDTTTVAGEGDSIIAKEIKSYFKEHPEDAIDGKLSNYTVERILDICDV